MARLPVRDLHAEVQRHFQGTPAQRVQAVLRLGERTLDVFLATQPPGLNREQARRILQRNRNRGRRRSAAVESLGR